MRRYKPSKMWSYSRAEIITIELAPVKYYMEDEMFIEEIEPLLQDATMVDFIELYKQYQRNYFKHNSTLAFYTYGGHTSDVFLLFNDHFFAHFKESRYYVRRESFKTLASYLIKEHYPNELTYTKAVNYLTRYGSDSFPEGRSLISFSFYQNDGLGINRPGL